MITYDRIAIILNISGAREILSTNSKLLVEFVDTHPDLAYRLACTRYSAEDRLSVDQIRQLINIDQLVDRTGYSQEEIIHRFNGILQRVMPLASPSGMQIYRPALIRLQTDINARVMRGRE